MNRCVHSYGLYSATPIQDPLGLVDRRPVQSIRLLRIPRFTHSGIHSSARWTSSEVLYRDYKNLCSVIDVRKEIRVFYHSNSFYHSKCLLRVYYCSDVPIA